MYERIKKRAEAEGMTIHQLEKEAGLGVSTIVKWKTSKPTIDNLFKVCDVLRCDISDLLGDLYEKKNHN